MGLEQCSVDCGSINGARLHHVPEHSPNGSTVHQSPRPFVLPRHGNVGPVIDFSTEEQRGAGCWLNHDERNRARADDVRVAAEQKNNWNPIYRDLALALAGTARRRVGRSASRLPLALSGGKSPAAVRAFSYPSSAS